MKLSPGPLVIATHNRGKFDEFRALLAPRGFEVTCNADHNLPEPDETETTFQGNALIKARAAAQALGVPALSDDSGMVVECLGGAPGVHTADWAETPSGRDFPMAMERVWREIGESGSNPPFRAEFVCVLALVWPDGGERIFEGRMPGQIIWPRRGEQGHGFDPIFQPDGFELTFGEMDPAQKNEISHRGRAVQAFLSDGVA
ncbi:MAG: non-canonical purine NTP pyrophosphatase [Rhodobacterales bacterium]|nr:MAG: non-canonical purine NTP pyrophosphatase [Rhodobacterales bacterium]